MTTDHGAIHSRCPIDQTRVFETHIHMCVWNIWTDVKLLPDDVAFCARVEVFHAVQKCQLQTLYGFHFKHQFWASGQWISFHPLPNEDGGLRLWYRDWSSRRTCNFPIFRQWQPAKPRTGMSFFNIFQLFSTFSTQPSTWCQYGFRNLSGKSTCFQPGLWRSSVLTLTRVYSLTQSCQV